MQKFLFFVSMILLFGGQSAFSQSALIKPLKVSQYHTYSDAGSSKVMFSSYYHRSGEVLYWSIFDSVSINATTRITMNFELASEDRVNATKLTLKNSSGVAVNTKTCSLSSCSIDAPISRWVDMKYILDSPISDNYTLEVLQKNNSLIKHQINILSN